MLCLDCQYGPSRVTTAVWHWQGRHHLKLLVDGEWRLAPDWPTEADANGVLNNVIFVE